ncbi:hypothetical protein [Chitinophaga tropicalis]|uniref:Uncharacterized protein n=1 Tax=Chitinophaga tropicalis TaxID=2683588 RepID=A0A7K1UAJ2_9BACT|nr:hypothetical protein [Chitinophaga tropicalis]MVT11392.1 hypothetical protein [Chitinophaga tropicalis]
MLFKIQLDKQSVDLRLNKVPLKPHLVRASYEERVIEYNVSNPKRVKRLSNEPVPRFEETILKLIEKHFLPSPRYKKQRPFTDKEVLRQKGVPDEHLDDAVTVVNERMREFGDTVSEAINYVISFVKKTQL